MKETEAEDNKRSKCSPASGWTEFNKTTPHRNTLGSLASMEVCRIPTYITTTKNQPERCPPRTGTKRDQSQLQATRSSMSRAGRTRHSLVTAKTDYNLHNSPTQGIFLEIDSRGTNIRNMGLLSRTQSRPSLVGLCRAGPTSLEILWYQRTLARLRIFILFRTTSQLMCPMSKVERMTSRHLGFQTPPQPIAPRRT